MAAAKKKTSEVPDVDLLELVFEIIAETGWSRFSFTTLADRAGMTLSSVRESFSSKPAIIDAFSQRLDQAMLAVDLQELKDLPPRDRVFELMMSRLEALSPLRAGAVRLIKDARREPELALATLCRLDRSMAWLQDAAGLSTNGLRSRLERHLLSGVYLKTLRSWSSDESADLAKTMAALDKDLRRVENAAGLGDRTSSPVG